MKFKKLYENRAYVFFLYILIYGNLHLVLPIIYFKNNLRRRIKGKAKSKFFAIKNPEKLISQDFCELNRTYLKSFVIRY